MYHSRARQYQKSHIYFDEFNYVKIQDLFSKEMDLEILDYMLNPESSPGSNELEKIYGLDIMNNFDPFVRDDHAFIFYTKELIDFVRKHKKSIKRKKYNYFIRLRANKSMV